MRRIVCLLLIIVFSIAGLYAAVHLAEIHYKKPQYVVNLVERLPVAGHFLDVEKAREELKDKEAAELAESVQDPFLDPDYDPYAAAYDNMMTEEEAETGYVKQEDCDLSATLNCSAVDDSEFSEIMGIAISLYGIAGYAILIILAIPAILVNRKKKNEGYRIDIFSSLIYIGCWIGFGFSVWLTYIEAIYIKAYCPYCLASAATMTLSLIACLIGYGLGPLNLIKKSK